MVFMTRFGQLVQWQNEPSGPREVRFGLQTASLCSKSRMNTKGKGTAMAQADKLMQASTDAAALIELLVSTRRATYDILADAIGIDKSTLFYFAKGKKNGKENFERVKQLGSIKLENFIKILNWVEHNNFSDNIYTEDQRSLATRLNDVMRGQDKGASAWIAQAFKLSPQSKSGILESLGGVHLGFRMRGKTGLIQVVGIRISDNSGDGTLEWRMKFREGHDISEAGEPIPDSQKKFREVRGFVSVEDNIVTCIGHQSRSKELYTLSVMRPERKTGTHNAMYMTYSEREAIARTVLLVHQEDIGLVDEVEVDNIIGDYHAKTDFVVLKNWGLDDVGWVSHGFSVNSKFSKSLDEEGPISKET
jgi:hypothetical protein